MLHGDGCGDLVSRLDLGIAGLIGEACVPLFSSPSTQVSAVQILWVDGGTAGGMHTGGIQSILPPIIDLRCVPDIVFSMSTATAAVAERQMLLPTGVLDLSDRAFRECPSLLDADERAVAETKVDSLNHQLAYIRRKAKGLC